MKKSYQINLEYKSFILYSPKNIHAKEKSNLLKTKLQKMKTVEKLMNKSKIIAIKTDESGEYTFHFSDEHIDTNILENYNTYLKRSIKVENNTLTIKGTKELECFSNKENPYSIELPNGYYYVHIFNNFDKNIYFFFEKLAKKPKLNITFNTNEEIITDKKYKRIALSYNHNYFMFNNYNQNIVYDENQWTNKNDNNFIYNMGYINITSGKLAIIDSNNIDNINSTISNNDYLNQTVPIGKYPVLLSMRKSHHYGNYITGLKIVFKETKTTMYIAAKTMTNNENFEVSSYYGAICDFDCLDNYSAIYNSFNYLPKEKNTLIKAFDENIEKHKDIIDKCNHFLLWDIPTTQNNVAIYNIELGINSYKAYFGIDEEENITELYIPLITKEIFNNKELTITKNKNKYINNYIDKIKLLINEDIKKKKENDEYIEESIINLYVQTIYEIQTIIFTIKDLNLEKEFILPFMELLEEFPNVNFHTRRNDLYYLISDKYETKNIIYDSTLKKPTQYKTFILAKYLYDNGYNKKENKALLTLLKNLRKNTDYQIRSEAKKWYKQLMEKRNRKIKGFAYALIIISMIITALIGPSLNYKTIVSNTSNTILTPYIDSVDEKYRVFYNSPNTEFEKTKMEKNEVWFSRGNNLDDTIRIHVTIFNTSKKEYYNNLVTQKNNTCSSNTKYSKINCYDFIDQENYYLDNIPYHYFNYSFVENESFYATEQYLIYELDDNNILCIYNQVYDISNEDFIKFSSNIIKSIKVKKQKN